MSSRTRASAVQTLGLTDLGNARRLVCAHGRDLRHVPGLGWYAFDGRRWRHDDDGEAMRRMKKTILALYQDAPNLPDVDRRTLVEHAQRSESERALTAAVKLAATELEVVARVDELDRDPWLLNVANGTLDLRTGELRAHERADLITKVAPVAYDPEATCPTWDAFIEQATGASSELAAFLARAAGYALAGVSTEHALFFLYGLGANGKTTFLVTLLRLLGEYAIQAEPDLLLVRRGEAHPTGVADLFGVRLAVCVEIDEGRRLAESLVKQLTGGDKLRARRMRQDFFQFDPTHTVMLAANHKPVVRGTDDAIWRRIKLVPFTVTVPPDRRDPDLPDKLAAELPGILNWALRGCLDWQRDGLRPSGEVETATASYRAEQDVLGAFLDERCVVVDTAYAKAADLYAAYTAWAEQAGERALTKKAFGLRLAERGFVNQKGTGGVRQWHGLGIQAGEGVARGA